MKLYLSSYRLGNDPKSLLALLSANKQTAVIMNATDLDDPLIRREKLQKEFSDLESLGIYAQEVDLRDFFGRKEELSKKILGYGMIWVRGGNSFVLRRAYAYSGLDEILQEKIADKDFVYSGYSAGICVLSPTLHGIEFVDDPINVPKGYNSEVLWEGLDMLPYTVVPHFKSDHPEAAAVETEVAYLTSHNIPFKTLKDGEVITDEINKKS